MNEYDIAELKFVGVVAVHFEKVRIFIRRYLDGYTVQAIVKLFRGGEEFLIPFDHVPARAHSQLIEQRNHTGQYLRYAAAHRS